MGSSTINMTELINHFFSCQKKKQTCKPRVGVSPPVSFSGVSRRQDLRNLCKMNRIVNIGLFCTLLWPKANFPATRRGLLKLWKITDNNSFLKLHLKTSPQEYRLYYSVFSLI